MSSSESSEDDEETRRINEAVVPNELLSTFTSFSSKKNLSKTKTDNNDTNSRTSNSESNGGSGVNDKPDLAALANKFKKVERHIDKSLLELKSNRPDKVTADDRSAYHATTPGFRAHIEKHLEQILDSDIDARIKHSVWKNTDPNKEKPRRGIKLFLGAKTLCFGDTNTQSRQDVRVVRSPPKICPRKHKLNSSCSESSDDEQKINACVFTVGDIVQENKMFNNLSKSGTDKDVEKDNAMSRVTNLDDGIEVNKPLMKQLEMNGSNTDSKDLIEMARNDKDGLATVCQSEVKKKKKKLHEKLIHNDKHSEEPVKKKRKKKRKSTCDSSTNDAS